jgi:hypothetical protein
MLKQTWSFLFILVLFAAGMGSLFWQQVEPLTEAYAREESDDDFGKLIVPDWLADDLRERFPEPARSMVRKELITAVQINMAPKTPETNPEPEIAAYISLDRLNGVFVLYAKQNGAYQPVYTKMEPVYGLQVIGKGEFLVLTSGFGGTGIQDNKLYVIHWTPQGYAEAWSGVAHSHRAQETVDLVDGNVQFDLSNNQMVYFRLERTLDATGVTLMERSSYELLRYSEKTMRFEK